MRKTEIVRNTGETQIKISLNLDGTGIYDGESNLGFLNHMLELMTRHGCFDLYVKAVGDTEVDMHHITEDTGITLGKAFSDALGDMRGITRYGSYLLPMDESLVLTALDFSGRPHLSYDLHIPSPKVGEFDTELVEEFFQGLCRSAGLTLHLKQLAGENSHHIIEAAFKGFGRALRQAVTIDAAFANEIPSTKGTLSL